MIPLKISIENCNELLPDERRRVLASEARKFADAGHRYRRVWRRNFTNVWHYVIKEHERLFWLHTYFKRIERNKRKVAA